MMTNIWIISVVAWTILGLMPAPCRGEDYEPTAPASSLDASRSGDPQNVRRVITVAEPISRAWPMRVLVRDASLQVHRPEFERMDGGRLEGRMAVVVEKSGAERDYYGSVKFSARALQNVDGRTTAIDEFSLGPSDFPMLPNESDTFLPALRQALEWRVFLIDTERLREEVSGGRTGEGARRSSAPPEQIDILYRERPTLLVIIDGEAVLRETASKPFQRVINSRALIVLASDTGRYYLWANGRWWEADSLNASWRAPATSPNGLDDLREDLMAQELVDPMVGEPFVSGAMLDILVRTTPTELLQSDGPPSYSAIAGTQLLYVANSPDRLFMELGTKTHYALVSGRWFRNTQLASEGWEYVPFDRISEEFRRIPATHPMADVLTAIPDTPAAREAMLANRVPRMASVSRSNARLEVDFDGEVPVLERIEGTALEYVANAPIAIILAPGAGYFAQDGGVWYRAPAVQGPWTPATSIPAAIYAIPADSPLHYVTYAKIYDVQDDVVVTGYTPGYAGSYVNVHNVVEYGPPRCYRPWIGGHWYTAPCGWGYGFHGYFSWYDTWNYRHGYRDRYKHSPHRVLHWPGWGGWRYRIEPRPHLHGKNEPHASPPRRPVIVRGPLPVGRANAPGTPLLTPHSLRDRAGRIDRSEPVMGGPKHLTPLRRADRARGDSPSITVPSPADARSRPSSPSTRRREGAPRLLRLRPQREGVLQGPNVVAPAIPAPGADGARLRLKRKDSSPSAGDDASRQSSRPVFRMGPAKVDPKRN